jgi:hypothetical protein
MAPEEIAGLAATPAAVAEWEDLLVRLEIMPRALRAALEDAGGGDADLTATLRALLARERRVGRWLEVAAFGSAEKDLPAPDGDARWLAERFEAVRARNFAMVQRRGVDVWAWAGEFDGAAVTVNQLLSWLVRSDAAVLAALRQSRPATSGVTAC